MQVNFFEKAPADIVQIILSKLSIHDLLNIRTINNLTNAQIDQYIFEQNDPEAIEVQTRLLFHWMVNKPNKFVVYQNNIERASKWINLLMKGLETNNTDWFQQFPRLFFINSLLNGPTITSNPKIFGLKQNSVETVLTPELLNDETTKYAKLIYYIAQLNPESTFNIIKNMENPDPYGEQYPKRYCLSLLIKLYPAFPPTIQTQVFEYILQLLTSFLSEEYLKYSWITETTCEYLAGIIRIAMQLEDEDRLRILDIIKNAYTQLQASKFGSFRYLNIVTTILNRSKEELNQFRPGHHFHSLHHDFIECSIKEYKPICAWLLEQLSSEIEFKNFMEELEVNPYSWNKGFIEWITKKLPQHWDSSVIDEALYCLACKIILHIENEIVIFEDGTDTLSEQGDNARERLAEIVKVSSTKGVENILQFLHTRQSPNPLNMIMVLQMKVYYDQKSTCYLTDFPSYFPAKNAFEVMLYRFLLGRPVDKSWVKEHFIPELSLVNDVISDLNDKYNNLNSKYIDKHINNDTLSLLLSVAEYNDLMTSLQKGIIINMLSLLAVYIRSNKLSIFYDVDIENVTERTYLSLLNLVPQMSPIQYQRFVSIVLDDLSLNSEHSREVSEILFKNRALIKIELAQSIIDLKLFDCTENMKLHTVLNAEIYRIEKCNASINYKPI